MKQVSICPSQKVREVDQLVSSRFLSYLPEWITSAFCGETFQIPMKFFAKKGSMLPLKCFSKSEITVVPGSIIAILTTNSKAMSSPLDRDSPLMRIFHKCLEYERIDAPSNTFSGGSRISYSSQCHILEQS